MPVYCDHLECVQCTVQSVGFHSLHEVQYTNKQHGYNGNEDDDTLATARISLHHGCSSLALRVCRGEREKGGRERGEGEGEGEEVKGRQ